MYLLKKSMMIVVGSIFLSLGINLFLIPYEILDGGIIGIGLILNYIWGLKVGLMIMFLSIPIFIIAWLNYREYFYNSLHGMVISAFIIDILKPMDSLLRINAVLSSILGGILVGLGIGLMLRFKTSTGGTDLIAQFLSDRIGINVGILIFIIDSIVVLCGLLMLFSNTLFLSTITILVVGLTTSFLNRNVLNR